MPSKTPYDQRFARFLIQPFVNSGLHPNFLTLLSLLLGVGCGALFVLCEPGIENIAVLVFMLAVFIDHMDGELARISGKTSRFGHFFDYIVGSLNYAILFCSIGIAIFRWSGSETALLFGLIAGCSNIFIVLLRLTLELKYGPDAVEHPSSSGFEIEDFIYLIGPITWLGGLNYFFWLYGAGTMGYLVWTFVTFLRKRLNQ
tara:strand:+ start:3704 stop:4306 length:603 start_codon:yes stop_codon:yes gene_type:complete